MKMSAQVIPIELGFVNCYLLKLDKGFILVDTGFSLNRGKLLKALQAAGCEPGHSLGSLAVLTGQGDCICGDLMANEKSPQPGPLVDDQQQMMASIQRLRDLGAKTVYPGHGKPFPMQALAL
jgi:glyoxylase-like metal-dependent hydrolase (beta-lactamase superfamily II)